MILKHHKFISFLFGLLYLISIQLFITPQPIFRFLIPAFVVYALALTIYNRYYLLARQKFTRWLLVRPLLLLVGLFGTMFLAPSVGLRGLVMVISVGLITVTEMLLGNTAENILLNETLVIGFGLIFSFSGFFYNWPGFETLYLIGIFLGVTLLARSFYETVPISANSKLVASMALGLFCSELFWALNFLQFHFSILALLLFNIFYLCLVLNYYYFFHVLNFKKVQFHVLLIAACDALVLLATPWNIIR